MFRLKVHGQWAVHGCLPVDPRLPGEVGATSEQLQETFEDHPGEDESHSTA